MAWMLNADRHVGRIPAYVVINVSYLLFSYFKTVKPSKPRCHADGPTEEGKDVVLKCMSSDGTHPLKYYWEKTSDNKLLPASAVTGKYAQDLQNKCFTSLKVPYYATFFFPRNVYLITSALRLARHVPKTSCFGPTQDKLFCVCGCECKCLSLPRRSWLSVLTIQVVAEKLQLQAKSLHSDTQRPVLLGPALHSVWHLNCL